MKKRPIGPALRLLRSRLGISQAELARRVECKSQSIWTFEHCNSLNTSSLFRVLESLGANLVDFHEALVYAQHLALEEVPEFPGLPPEEAEAAPAAAGKDTSLARHTGVPVLGSDNWWQRATVAMRVARQPSPARAHLRPADAQGEPAPEALRVVLHALGCSQLPAEKETEAFRLLRFVAQELAELEDS